MMRGRFKEKQIKFNEKQLELIRAYSTIGLSKLTGIPESQCYFIRANKPKDYQLSTLRTLAKGFGLSVSEFLDLE